MITEALDLLNRIADLGNADAQRDFLLFVGGRVGTLAESHLRAAIPEEPNGRPLELFYTRTSEAKKPYKLKGGLIVGRPGEQFKSKFKSLKQQRKVIMLAKQGKIPRSRTGFLPNSYTHAVTFEATGAIVSVGTNLDYAEWVVGNSDVQSHYHQESNWKPVSETIAAHTDDYGQEIVTSGKPWLVGYLKGGK